MHREYPNKDHSILLSTCCQSIRALVSCSLTCGVDLPDYEDQLGDMDFSKNNNA